jgi:hypothetical protein
LAPRSEDEAENLSIIEPLVDSAFPDPLVVTVAARDGKSRAIR